MNVNPDENILAEVDAKLTNNEYEVTLENFDGPFKEAQNIASEKPIGVERSQSHSQSENSLRNKTAKRSKVDEEVVVLKREALMNSTIEFVKATKLPISENETWTLLEELGVESHLLSTCYLFFIRKPDMLRGLLRCPLAFRKDLLCR
ncbi:hypothetical protein GH714_022621 [Hevea brasiliensis]|uniref:Uncharacterized protein n=1 Tax=Hevea brasiliensis TaxID=3981 RepID=A0A6A6M8M6_HEVBR|nr:hypothetical protein GH714_022621 [Hevea brasiliensis]